MRRPLLWWGSAIALGLALGWLLPTPASAGVISPPAVTSIVAGVGLAGGGGAGSVTLSAASRLGNGGQKITAASYLIAAGDMGTLLLFTGSSSAFSLPAATSTGFGYGGAVEVSNHGSGTVTVTPTTSTIDGSASFSIPAGRYAVLYSDGANYSTDGDAALQTMAAIGLGIGLTNTGTTAAPVIVPTASITAVTATAATTLTAAALLSGEIDRSGPTAAFTDTVDTAANIIAAAGASGVTNGTFRLTLRNVSSYVETLAAGTGDTLNGSVQVRSGSSVDIRGYVTSATTVTLTAVTDAPLAAYSVLNNNTSGTAAPTPSSSPTLNRYLLSGSTTSASGTGLAGGATANSACVQNNSAFHQCWDQYGHEQTYQATAPTVTNGTLGTGGTDVEGSVTASGSATSLTLTFVSTRAAAPLCIAFPVAGGSAPAITYGGSSPYPMTLTALSGNLTGSFIYHCGGV